MPSESASFIYEYLKEDYDRETERYSRHRDRISFVSGFVLLLGSGITTLLTNYVVDFKNYGTRDVIFLTGVVCSVCFFGITLWYLLRATIPKFLFANVAPADVMWESYSKWVKHASDERTADKIDVESLFRKSISASFAKAAASNRKRTNERSELLSLAMRTAVIAAIFLVAPAACCVLKIYDKSSPEPIRVEVINPIKIN